MIFFNVFLFSNFFAMVLSRPVVTTPANDSTCECRVFTEESNDVQSSIDFKKRMSGDALTASKAEFRFIAVLVHQIGRSDKSQIYLKNDFDKKKSLFF